MASNLYPLVYKPGLKRDGTLFQSEYCTNGQWIRFNEGRVKKIGGMLAAPININQNASNVLLLPSTDNNIDVYIASSTAINFYRLNSNFNYTGQTASLLPALPPGVEYNLWQSEIVVNPFETVGPNDANGNPTKLTNPKQQTIYLGVNNGGNAVLYSGVIGDELVPNNKLILNDDQGYDPTCNRGICFAAPFLFGYGKNGVVQWSAPNNLLRFNGGGSGSQSIANDDIIYGKVIRGGANTPTVLFWSESSVVRFINDATGDSAPAFTVDTISKSSSILSTRCVVEYDGVFFWPGTDRFFAYNGIVQEVLNNINFDYFFDNIDMDYRQNVFGVKNPKYGEIWWFYPEKMGAPGRPAVDVVPLGVNTRALIYNKRENTWYDTAISRNCGTYSDGLGLLATYGNPLVNNDNNNYLWFHEQGIVQKTGNNSVSIMSSFTTPTISWAAFNPLKQLTGVDRWTEIKRIEPDFVMDNNTTMNVAINTQEYAQSAIVTSDPYTFYNDTGKIDIHLQGRHITFTFSSIYNFEMGHVMLLLSIGDGR